jgi:hypothetical protein
VYGSAERPEGQVAAKGIKQGLDSFKGYMPAVVPVALVSALLILLFWWFVGRDAAPLAGVAPFGSLLLQARAERVVFLCYFIVLFAMWAVYFTSSFQWGRIRTLRKLLSLTSEIFGRTSVEAEAKYEGDETGRSEHEQKQREKAGGVATALREKARNSLTMLAMLTAGATLLLTRSLDMAYAAPSPDFWQLTLAYASASAALIAVVCFIISVDSFDVMYNMFGAEDGGERNHMLQFFYNSTRNTRYYGTMFLLWALCLFAAARHPVFGAFATSLVICIGWAHWFPSPTLLGQPLERGMASRVFSFIVRLLFIVFPAFWGLLHSRVGFFLTGN